VKSHVHAVTQHRAHEMVSNCPPASFAQQFRNQNQAHEVRERSWRITEESPNWPLDSSSRGSELNPDLARMSHTLPPEPHAFGRDLPKQAHQLEKETTFDNARHAAHRERRRIPRHGSSVLGGGGTQHGTSSGWSSASASEPAEGSDPEPAQTRILRQPFLDRAIGGGIARSCRAAAAAASVSQSNAQLWGARAFLEPGAEQDGSEWPLCSFYAARLSAALLVCLRLCTSALHGVFIFWTPPRALRYLSSTTSFTSLCFSLS
jgi:hypothetical protein